MKIIVENIGTREISEITEIAGLGTVLQNYVVIEIAHAPTAANCFLDLHLAGFGVEMASPLSDHPFVIANKWQEDELKHIGDDRSGWHLSDKMLQALAELEELPF